MNPLRSALLAAIACLALVALPRAARGQESIGVLLEAYRVKYAMPALAAAVVKHGKVVAAGAVGTRRAGEDIPVSLRDRFHIGSDTKAMTALVAAQLVEEGKLRWDSTVAEVFPELSEGMDAVLRGVTLEQLLSHTSGLPPDGDVLSALLLRSAGQDGNLDELRYWLVKEWSPRPLGSKPGETFTYSNMGFVFVGAMLERTTGKTWEELVTDRVFAPLGLASAGFGPQATLGRVDAPLGHQVVDGRLKAFLAGPDGDNPAILGPAGTVHLSVLDFARWAGWNAGEGARGPALVQPETLKKLHTPVITIPERKDAAPGTPARGGAGLGWGQVEVTWSDAPLGFHGGSNGRNLAHIWIQPEHDYAMVIVTNIATEKAEEGLYALAAVLYARFGPAQRAFAAR